MTDHNPIPFDPTGGGGRPPIDPKIRSCDSMECVDALSEVVAARGIITFKCGQVASARSWMNTLAAIAATLLGLAIAAFAAASAATATFFGIPLGLALFVTGVVLLAAAILFALLAGIAAILVLVLEGELNQARVNFATATSRVTATCPTTCWGDLTMPSC